MTHKQHFFRILMWTALTTAGVMTFIWGSARSGMSATHCTGLIGLFVIAGIGYIGSIGASAAAQRAAKAAFPAQNQATTPNRQ